MMLRSCFAIAATTLGSITMAYPVAAAMVTFDFTRGDDGGFIISGSSLWAYTGTQWQTTEANNAIGFLDSPEFKVDNDGTVNISLEVKKSCSNWSYQGNRKQ